MSATFAQFGNDLHAGRRTLPIVRRRKLWYAISVVLLVLLGSVAALRGVNLGIEFTGGSEFQVSGVASTDQAPARDAVREVVPDNEPKITVLGSDTVRVQTAQLDSERTSQLAQDLARTYDVPADNVSSSYIGPIWGQDVTGKMIRGVVVFLVLVGVVMALYFRNVKASTAAMIALVHDMLVTAVVYGVVGFEVTPATIIGFLTILGYSLYDTIVVFDKVRENTADFGSRTDRTFAELVELAANQTVMRSINTSVVALLPVGSILAIGAFLLGAGTLKDISLALFIGIVAGTYSSIFLAPGLLVDLRLRERSIREHTARVEAARRNGTPGHAAAADGAAPADAVFDAVDDGGDDTADDTTDHPADSRDDDADVSIDAGQTPDSDTDEPARVGTTRIQPRRTPRRRRTGPTRKRNP